MLTSYSPNVSFTFRAMDEFAAEVGAQHARGDGVRIPRRRQLVGDVRVRRLAEAPVAVGGDGGGAQLLGGEPVRIAQRER